MATVRPEKWHSERTMSESTGEMRIARLHTPHPDKAAVAEAEHSDGHEIGDAGFHERAADPEAAEDGDGERDGGGDAFAEEAGDPDQGDAAIDRDAQMRGAPGCSSR